MFSYKKRDAFTMIACLISFNLMFAEIRNGYESDVHLMRRSLAALKTLLVEDSSRLSVFQRSGIKDDIRKLEQYITYFELTEELLIQFKSIAPDMYNEFNNLKDRAGRFVTVYVRFVPESEMQNGVAGTTNVAHLATDENTHSSEFGPHTVSVKIASVSRALFLLAHELGHVAYQVPRIADYFVYYVRHYMYESNQPTLVGHNTSDPSGKTANEYESRFREHYIQYILHTHTKPKNPLTLLIRIRKISPTLW